MAFLPQIENLADAYDVKEYTRRSRVETWADQGKRWHHELHWTHTDGTQTSLVGNHFSGELLPAGANFEIINVTFDVANDQPTIERQPVIGWRIVYDNYVYGEVKAVGQKLRPLVQHVNSEPLDISGVRQPDGRVFSRGKWYADEDAFLAGTESRWLEKREQKLLEERHKDCPFCAEKRRQVDDDVPF
jgi:hypothetical protein